MWWILFLTTLEATGFTKKSGELSIMQLVGLFSKMFFLTTNSTLSLLEQRKLDTFCAKHHYDDSNYMNPGNGYVGITSVMKYMNSLE